MKEVSFEKIDLDSSSYLKPRPYNWHKGQSGHVLIVGSTLGYLGASLLAGLGALRVGAGLVSIATRKEHAAAMSASFPELMCHGVSSIEELNPLIHRADVMVLGPGLGQDSWSKELYPHVCSFKKIPLILDADGLNLLALSPQKNTHWILTPHPGEAARLLNQPLAAIEADRLKAVCSIQKQYEGIAVLKGANTLVMAKDGRPAICSDGNPGMASGGMGDVLSGVIAGLIAQKIPCFEAAKLGVGIHAKAGDLAAKKGQRGMIATDLMPYLRQLCNPL